MIKIFVVLTVLISSIYGTQIQLGNDKALDKSENKKSINLVSDYKELESILIKTIASGDNSKLIALASLYDKDWNLKDGYVKADFMLAKKYYQKALNKGYGLASIPLIKNSKTIDDALLILEQGLKGNKNKIADKTIIAVAYNGLILDNKFFNKKYVHKALDLTYPISQVTNIASLDFTIANLLQISGNYKEANLYLNTACNNPNADAEIKDACLNSMGISKDKKSINSNIEKTKECDTCGVYK